MKNLPFTQAKWSFNGKVVLVMVVMLGMMGADGFSQVTGDYRSNAATMAWSTAGSWQRYNGTTWVTATTAPTSANGIVTILAGHSVTVGTNASCSSLKINNSASTLTTMLTISASSTLTVGSTGTGLVTIGSAEAMDNGKTSTTSLVVNGNLVCGNIDQSPATRNNGSGGSGNTNLTISGTGIVTSNGNISGTSVAGANSTTGTASVVFTGPGSLSLTGNFTTSIFTTSTGCTFNYSGGTQTVRPTAYYNLVLAGSGDKSVASGTSVAGNLSMVGTTASLANGINVTVGTLTLGGIRQLAGTYGSTASDAKSKKSDYFGTTLTGIITVNSTPGINDPGMWIGLANTDWNNIGNWGAAGIPASNVTATILSGATYYPVITTSLVYDNITIESGASLTIAPGASLTVNNTLTNGAGAAGLVIQSTSLASNGTGSIIVSNAVNATVERYLTGLVTLDPLVEKWHAISSPVAAQDLSTFLSQGIDHWNNAGTERYGFAPYLEPTNYWNYLSGTPTGTLTVGQGYEALLATATGTVDFVGQLNYENVNPSVTRTAGAAYGWNLIGNPYPSGINVASFIAGNSAKFETLYPSLYVWNADLKRWDITIDGDIPVGQGFFVRVATGVTQMNITTGMRTHTMSAFKSAESADPTVRLIAESSGNSSNTRILYIPGKTRGIDETGDIAVFSGQKPEFEVFTHLLEGSTADIGLQSLPDDYENLVVPVGLTAKQGSQVTFKAEVNDFPSNMKVYLEDRIKGKFTRIDESGSSYTVTLTSASSGIGRFYLHTTQGAMGVENVLEDGLTVFALPQQQLIRVVGTLNIPAQASVYDISGRVVKSVSLENSSENVINLPPMKNGIYILHIQSDSKSIKRKISWSN